jgi:hypothetical protein
MIRFFGGHYSHKKQLGWDKKRVIRAAGGYNMSLTDGAGSPLTGQARLISRNRLHAQDDQST